MTDRPEDVDAAFAEIVADLEREGVGAGLDADPDPREDRPGEAKAPPGPPPAAPPSPPAPPVPPPPAAAGRDATRPESTWRGHGADWDFTWSSDDDHYVPPEPPPLPRLRPMTIAALLLLLAGIVLLVAPGIAGLDTRFTTPIGLIALASGGCLLLFRIRRHPPTDLDRDDGAQL